MLKNHFKTAWRTIKRNKFFAFINVIGLSLGICSCIIIFLSYHFELSFDTFHPYKERIYRLTSQVHSDHPYAARIPPPMPSALRKEISGLEAISCSYPYYTKIAVRDEDGKEKSFDSHVGGTDDGTSVIITDKNYFSIFQYDWLAGNPATSLDDPAKVVLSESKARKYFGELSPGKMIGKEVVYDDSVRVTVSGIVKDWNKNTDFPFTDFVSFSTINSYGLRNKYHTDEWRPIRGNPWVWSFIKLGDKATPVTVGNQLKLFLAHHLPGLPIDSLKLKLQPLSDIHFNNAYTGDDILKASLPALRGLMGIALFILTIAIINFINLSTALSIQRSKETGIRKVLGSSKRSLQLQFLSETFLITFFAMCLAVLLVKPVLLAFSDYIPFGVVFSLSDPPTLLFLLSITLFTSLLAGFYPAKVLSSYLPVISLKGSGEQKGNERWWLRKSLIVFQFTVSLIFIISTLVVGKQVRYMLHSDFGFKTDAVVTIDTDWKEKSDKLELFEQKIKQLPGIDQVVRQSNPPIGWGHSGLDLKYKAGDEIGLKVSFDLGDEDFISFYQIRLLAGRNLLPGDSLKEFVVNETCTKALGCKTPSEAIGKFLYRDNKGSGQKAYPIVGVVADFHEGSFHDPIQPLVIGHMPEDEKSLGIRLASTGKEAGNIKGILSNMEKIWKEIYPNEPMDYRFMDESITSIYEEEEKLSFLMKASVIVSTFISCIGLLGIAMFSTEKRTKEIGIRKVLGAGVLNIATMLTKDFIVLVMLSLLIATPVAWYFMHQWLQDFAYRIPLSWWIFPLAGLSAIGVVLLTISFQVTKAAVANPIRSLRAE